jgi:Uncharacterised protein family (UPF0158)
MAILIPSDKLKEIAQDLEAGLLCWYHIPTREVLSVPDRMKSFDIDEEIWEDTFNEIDEKMHECIAFEGPDSREEFKIMESFAENEVSDSKIRSRLIYALNQRKPFMHFKSAIHYESDYLKAWYAYKSQWYMDHVQELLSYHNSKLENKKVEDKEDSE